MSPRSMVALTIMSFMEQFNEAVTFAQSHEIPWPRDPTADLAHCGVHHDDPPPFNRLRGPVRSGQQSGGPVARWLDGEHSAGFVRRVAQALRS